MPFCSKCGEKIENEVRFCPLCGTKIVTNKKVQENQQKKSKSIVTINQEQDFGRLVVSTETMFKIKMGGYVMGILCCIIGLFLAFNIQDFIDVFEEILDNDTLSTIGAWGCSLLSICMPILFIQLYKSHCNVYEKAVTGITCFNFSLLHYDVSMQKFTVRYEDIMDVTEGKNSLFIYTKYTTYEVYAMTNRGQALQEIKKRIPRASTGEWSRPTK